MAKKMTFSKWVLRELIKIARKYCIARGEGNIYLTLTVISSEHDEDIYVSVNNEYWKENGRDADFPVEECCYIKDPREEEDGEVQC